MTDQETLRQQLKAMLEKGQRTLRASQDHLAKGDADFASSKAYYAVFHLVQAVLLTKGLTYSKHAGVIAGFSEHFLKSGIFPKEFGQAIQRLRKDRELGDYGYQLSVNSQDAAEDVKAASEIIDRLAHHLQPLLSF